MSKNTVVEFTKEELKLLLDDSNSCVKKQRSIYSLALYPYHLSDCSSSIKELLNSRIAKYEKKLGGILLGYKNITLLTSQGTIVADSCHVHIEIEADFYIFKPEIGSSLNGIVNKKSEDHVGCLVHRVFNISVPKLDKTDEWVGHLVEIGQEVMLNVTYINLDARLPYIRSSFDLTQFKITEISSSTKKKRKNGINEQVQNSPYEDDGVTTTPVHKKKKHKSNITEMINSYEEDERINKSKKKYRKLISKEFIERDSTNEDKTNEQIDWPKEKKRKDKRKSKERSESDTSIFDNELVKSKNKKRESNKKDRNIFEIDTSICDASLNLISEKIIKDSENTQVKNKKHSKTLKESLNVLQEEISKKKKRKSLNIEEESHVAEHFSTPIHENKDHKKLEMKQKKNNVNRTPTMADAEDRKTKSHRKSMTGDNILWENVTLNLHDSDLEETLAKSLSPKSKKKNELDDAAEQYKKYKKHKNNDISKKKRKNSELLSGDDSYNEEPKFKKCKYDNQMVPDENIYVVKKHKSKKTRNSIEDLDI